MSDAFTEAASSESPTNGVTTRIIPGMNCQGCVKRMREAIQSGDPEADVTGTPSEKRLKVVSSLTDAELDQRLTAAGYPPGEAALEEAAPDDADKQPETAAPADAETEKTASAHAHSQGQGKKQRLAISGMTCASCVNSVQKALERTEGVVTASVNFGTHSAQVFGSAKTQALIAAVESAGYGAEPIVDMREAERTRAEQDAKTYQKRLRGSAISLALAIPLMLSMLFFHPHPMGLGRLYWLGIGLLTLGIMAFPGRHFFVNAWKQFKHHQANMDTLVALGTGTAWLYSMAVVLFAPWLPEVAQGIYFEASAW